MQNNIKKTKNLFDTASNVTSKAKDVIATAVDDTVLQTVEN
jgi:hypothetical protein